MFLGECGESRHKPTSPETPLWWNRGEEGHVVLHCHCQLCGDLQWSTEVGLTLNKTFCVFVFFCYNLWVYYKPAFYILPRKYLKFPFLVVAIVPTILFISTFVFLRDLLSKDGEKLDIKINPDGTGHLHVPGLRLIEVRSFQHIKKVTVILQIC